MRLAWCKACAKVKPYWEFAKCRRSANKLYYVCRSCSNAINVQWRLRPGSKESELARHREYMKKDVYRVSKRLMQRMSEQMGVMRRAEGIRLIGCSWQEVTDYLLAQLKEGESLNDFQIDHIRPFASASKHDMEAMKAICHYTNLQLLPARLNMSKGAKYCIPAE